MTTNEQNDMNRKLYEAFLELKILLELQHKPIATEWLPREHVMNYLGYASTQMSSVEKREKLLVTKVGKRKFYHRDSILEMLNNNIIK